jgi:hypothetical protein
VPYNPNAGQPIGLDGKPVQTMEEFTPIFNRLTSLEQGIGSLQNQIASLLQMSQASDPFGLGGFMNQRRF